MALSKSTFKANLKPKIAAACQSAADASGATGDWNAWKSTFSEELATAISDEVDTFVKSAQIAILPVQVSPATGNGATVGPHDGAIS